MTIELADLLGKPRTSATSIGTRLAIVPPVVALIVLGGTTNSASPPRDTRYLAAAAHTGIGGFPADMAMACCVPDQLEQPSTADTVRGLHRRSGLTWDELARIFDVSRRTVHAWANGSRMNQAHAARLSDIAASIEIFAHPSPDQTRAALHAPAASGVSPYQGLVRSLALPGNRREGFDPRQLLAGGDSRDLPADNM